MQRSLCVRVCFLEHSSGFSGYLGDSDESLLLAFVPATRHADKEILNSFARLPFAYLASNRASISAPGRIAARLLIQC